MVSLLWDDLLNRINEEGLKDEKIVEAVTFALLDFILDEDNDTGITCPYQAKCFIDSYLLSHVSNGMREPDEKVELEDMNIKGEA